MALVGILPSAPPPPSKAEAHLRCLLLQVLLARLFALVATSHGDWTTGQWVRGDKVFFHGGAEDAQRVTMAAAYFVWFQTMADRKRDGR